MIAAANRGANVYLLLDSYNSSSTNTPTKTYLDNLGISTLHCLLDIQLVWESITSFSWQELVALAM